MGVFGTGLYSGDFAMDLRSTIRAVSRLPFAPDRLVEILCESEPDPANSPTDEDHTTFWLVVADQFARRGIDSARVRETAFAIIDNGADLARLDDLGMKASDIQKRRKMLSELRARLEVPLARKRRAVLKLPQPLLMEVGDLFVYPTSAGNCINPYFPSKTIRRRDGSIAWTWEQDGWAAMVIVDRGRAFDFLSWYRSLTVARATREKPTLEALRGAVLWKLGRPGTCSATHMKRMELGKIGVLPIGDAKLRRAFADIKSGVYQAVNDISLANELGVAPYVPDWAMPVPGDPSTPHVGRPYPTILGVTQILSD